MYAFHRADDALPGSGATCLRGQRAEVRHRRNYTHHLPMPTVLAPG